MIPCLDTGLVSFILLCIINKQIFPLVWGHFLRYFFSDFNLFFPDLPGMSVDMLSVTWVSVVAFYFFLIFCIFKLLHV